MAGEDFIGGNVGVSVLDVDSIISHGREVVGIGVAHDNEVTVQSEANQKCLLTGNRLAPCTLWIDEKAVTLCEVNS